MWPGFIIISFMKLTVIQVMDVTMGRKPELSIFVHQMGRSGVQNHTTDSFYNILSK